MKHYLISFPRSGNTWVRALLEKYTELSSRSLYERINEHGQVVDGPLFYNTESTVIWKSHYFKTDTFHLDSDDKVIFILRDFKDALLKHTPAPIIGKHFSRSAFLNYFHSFKNTFRDEQITPVKYSKFLLYKLFIVPLRWVLEIIKSTFTFLLELIRNDSQLKGKKYRTLEKYCDVLKDFDECKNKKIIVYYEDLITDFEKNFKEILLFMSLPIDKEKITALTEQQKKTFMDTKESLKKTFGKTLSDDMNFIGRHRNIMSESEIKEMNNFVITHHPKISKIYLERYLV